MEQIQETVPEEIPLTRRQKILNRRNKAGRVYAGQIVCAETYKQMSTYERAFWNKCLQTHLKGKTLFKYQGVDHVVPWMTTDGKFSTMKHLQELQELQERLENGESITGLTDSSNNGADGLGEPENLVEDPVIESTV